MEQGALGRYLTEIRRHPLLDREEELDLARRARAGEADALDHLVRSNLRLVVAVARRHARGAQSLEELINEGNVGLVRAARRFDPARNVRFATYAVWWIRQAVLAALSRESRIVRRPAHRMATARRAARTLRELQQRSAGRWRADVVADRTGISEAAVREAASCAARDVSLDAPMSEGGGCLLDVIADPAEAGLERALESEALKAILAARLDRLPADEAGVIRACFGLSDAEPATLADVAERFGMSRERVATLRDRGLRRMRREGNPELASFARD